VALMLPKATKLRVAPGAIRIVSDTSMRVAPDIEAASL
jgi:hypothetical protein